MHTDSMPSRSLRGRCVKTARGSHLCMNPLVRRVRLEVASPRCCCRSGAQVRNGPTDPSAARPTPPDAQSLGGPQPDRAVTRWSADSPQTEAVTNSTVPSAKTTAAPSATRLSSRAARPALASMSPRTQ